MVNTYLIYGNKDNEHVQAKINELISQFTTSKYSELIITEYNNDSVSEIHQFINSTPLIGDRKVLICYEFNECDIKLQNKLLKDIEESYSDTLQLYVSNSAMNILPTIISRLLPIYVTNNDLLSKFNNIDQQFLEKFNFNFEQLNYILYNVGVIDMIQKVYKSTSYSNLYLKYTVDKWTKELALLLLNVYYIKAKEDNLFAAIKIINDYEQIFLSNAKFELQYEVLLIKLKEIYESR